MASATELRRRWFEPGGPALTRAVERWLGGHGGRPTGLEDVAGRVDLRGLPLSASPLQVGDSTDADAGRVWESLDLRGADVAELRLFGSHLHDCLFDRAACTGWRVWGSTVEDCSFVGADLRSRGLGGGGPWRGRTTAWRRVDFTRARLGGSQFDRCVLDSCTFDGPGRRLVISDCEVSDVVVRGPVPQLIVTGVHAGAAQPPTFSGDLSMAVFHDSHVIGHRLPHVLLPTQDDVRLIRDLPTRLPALLTALLAGGPAGRRTAATWERWLQHPGGPGTDLLLDLGTEPETVAAVDAALAAAGAR